MQKCSLILFIYINLFNISVRSTCFIQCKNAISNYCAYICRINCQNICSDKEEQVKIISLLLIFTIIFYIVNIVSSILYITVTFTAPTVSTSLSFVNNITTPLQYINNPLGCYGSHLTETVNGINCCPNPIQYPPLATFYCTTPSACGSLINNNCNQNLNNTFSMSCSDCVAPIPSNLNNNLCTYANGSSYPSSLYCCNHVPINCYDISSCYTVQTPNECNGFTANNFISCCCNNQSQQMPSPTYCCDNTSCDSTCQVSNSDMCSNLPFNNLCCFNNPNPVITSSLNNYTLFNNYTLPFVTILALCINICKYITIFSIIFNRNTQYNESSLLKKYFKTIFGVSICCQIFLIFYNIVMVVYFFDNNIIWLFVTHLIEGIVNIIKSVFFLLFICAPPRKVYNCCF